MPDNPSGWNTNIPLPPTPDGDTPVSFPNRWDVIRASAAEVMAIDDITHSDGARPMRIRGRLMLSAEAAFLKMRPAFESVGHTPHLKREGAQDVVYALPAVFGKARTGIPWLNIALLALTLVSVFIVGVGQHDQLYLPPLMVLTAQITGSTAAVPYPELMPTPEVWRAALGTGVLYTLALLGILGTHEMGHYLMSRRHGISATLPFFIPFPNLLGTLGAVIAMREPTPNRKVQFDIGVAGPLAGLFVAIPVLLIGLLLSQVGTVDQFIANLPEALRGQTSIMSEGNSLAYLAAKFVVFGRILPAGGEDVWIHPVAFAGWAGLLVTALNLLPVGQLDGGHVVYGLFGEKARRFRTPVIVVLVILTVVGWFQDFVAALRPEQIAAMGERVFSVLHAIAALPIPGWQWWGMWVFILLVLMRNHAPVLDEITELDPKRRALGIAMLVVFILIFTPRPLVITPLGG
ncbi:MAG: site-2 protease family protein [Anaerolineae bacterium]|nr:site-2 protease family protein [Anaerolineae bacterium]